VESLLNLGKGMREVGKGKASTLFAAPWCKECYYIHLEGEPYNRLIQCQDHYEQIQEDYKIKDLQARMNRLSYQLDDMRTALKCLMRTVSIMQDICFNK
jgi:hypothetical protein